MFARSAYRCAAEPSKDFEEAYGEVTVASHKEAVTLFDEVADDNKDADVRTFAAKMLPKLRSHGGMEKERPG